ncbi:DUF938 domain-containing protein [Ottowia sp.]|uniref:DUF938 domain-containing protein n=1 Tax=Ottowia sp. TaxID=1898956 RepID=UPI0039E60D1A
MPLPHSPAAERNRVPILVHLQALLPPTGRALEIASGTGQHAAHFAAALPGWTWQPTDADDALFGAIAGWSREAGARNVLPPRRLDVRDAAWPSDDGPRFDTPFDLVFAANLLHISPWEGCAGLMLGAARHLSPGGLLVTYGPYLEDDVPTAPSNLAFDADLRARNPAWGLRRLADVANEAGRAGLAPRERHAMPANNLLLVFDRV